VGSENGLNVTKKKFIGRLNERGAADQIHIEPAMKPQHFKHAAYM
jgi:hypothetical protein